MENRETTKEYSNGELTIVWKPKTCIHAAVCVQTLPRVYNPAAKPWITIENATTEELKAQIDRCPSGALSYYMVDKQGKVSEPSPAVEIQVLRDGPLLVKGHLEVAGINGEVEIKDDTTAFCRCGASNNKPYCDGEHLKTNFHD